MRASITKMTITINSEEAESLLKFIEDHMHGDNYKEAKAFRSKYPYVKRLRVALRRMTKGDMSNFLKMYMNTPLLSTKHKRSADKTKK